MNSHRGPFISPDLPLWVPQPGYPLFCPFFSCELRQATSNFPRISTVGSPCAYLTVTPWVRPCACFPISRAICSSSPLHTLMHCYRRVRMQVPPYIYCGCTQMMSMIPVDCLRVPLCSLWILWLFSLSELARSIGLARFTRSRLATLSFV